MGIDSWDKRTRAVLLEEVANIMGYSDDLPVTLAPKPRSLATPLLELCMHFLLDFDIF